MSSAGKDNVERRVEFEDLFGDPDKNDVVSFSVVCVPRSAVDLENLRRHLSIETLAESLPTDKVRDQVADQLRTYGFRVFDLPSPVVSAMGTVGLFQQTFKVLLRKRIRTFRRSNPPRVETTIVLAPGNTPSPDAVTGALAIVIAEPPIPTVPRIPGPTPAFCLHLPGDIAQLTAASLTHRLVTPAKDRATGGSVGVAVIDTEFADHPYFRDNGYRIARVAPSDASCLGEGYAHGTSVLSCMLACAPDVQAFGITLGLNALLAFDLALAMPGVKVISFSFVWSLDGVVTIPVAMLPLQMRILTAVASGVTIVVAAGDGDIETFPALMQEVVAVGGVTVDATDAITPWPGSSSFVSAINPGRAVPDLCGMSEAILTPTRGPAYWISSDGTSLATPQVAGIAALLIQKSPLLTPQQVRNLLCGGAVPVAPGPPSSPATGAGLVNAFNSWTSIV